MTKPENATFAIDFDDYDINDAASLARLRSYASSSLDKIDRMLEESAANFKRVAAVAQTFVSAAQQRAGLLESSYQKRTEELQGARHAADAVLQFSRRCSACLDERGLIDRT